MLDNKLAVASLNGGAIATPARRAHEVRNRLGDATYIIVSSPFNLSELVHALFR